jgi:hypothetical protein
MPPAPEIASLAFHQVTDEPASTGFQRPGAVPFALTRQTFARCLERIQASDSSPALVTDFDLTRPGRHFLLTLDGGGIGCLRGPWDHFLPPRYSETGGRRGPEPIEW